MTRKKDREISPMRAKFAENFGKELMTQTEAARQAGYEEPNARIAALMADPLVVARIMDHLRKGAVKWRALAAKAKGVLMEGLEAMKTVKVKDGPEREIPHTAMRLEAARIVLMALRKESGHLLEDAATAEDVASEESDIALAKQIIGAPPKPESSH